MSNNQLTFYIALIVSSLIFLGCTDPLKSESSTGSLSLTIGEELSRTLSPDLSMDPTEYFIQGTGPEGTAFSLNTSDPYPIVDNLMVGLWTVHVTAFNDIGIAIGEGFSDLTMNPGGTNRVKIFVKPLVGNGSLSLEITWPPVQVTLPEIVATLLPLNGQPISLIFTLDQDLGTASSLIEELGNGYYTLSLQLLDDGQLSMGAMELVRIVKGQMTFGSYEFNNINQPTGSLNVQVTPQMDNPLEISITGANSGNIKPTSQSNILTGVTENFVGSVSYVWSVNGTIVFIGDEYIFDDTWPVGNYRIDVAAYSADGTRAGSSNMNIRVFTALNLPINSLKLSGGYAHSMVVDSQGGLWSFGYNISGQLGDGTWDNRLSPVPIMNQVTSVAAGTAHSVVLKTDGSVWTFGQNSSGELGDGTNTDRNTPIPVFTGASAVAAGNDFTVVLKTDGTLWTWGGNTQGQLGNGANSNSSTPVLVMTGVTAISTGFQHTLALRSNGTLWAFGIIDHGALGEGPEYKSNIPVQILSGVVSIEAGGYHTLAEMTNGNLLSVGLNSYGQLGDGTTTNQTGPISVFYEDNVLLLSAGSEHSLILSEEGNLYAFGQWVVNNQLTTPTYIQTGVLAIGTGDKHSLFITDDGSLWAIGSNNFGQLGDGTATTRLAPVVVPGWHY